MQLLDLPEVRRVVGLLRPEFGADEAPRSALERYSWKNRIRDYYRCKNAAALRTTNIGSRAIGILSA